MTVSGVAATATRVLTDAGFSPADARTDVSVLARAALGWTAADWIARAGERAPVGFHDKLLSWAHRRGAHEPVAYIAGAREFYGRSFRVTPAVLIPRPETELVIEETLRLVDARISKGVTPPVRSIVVDVGTGSGCIAITLALEMPDLRVVATDISPAALEVARANARELGADVEFIETSLLPRGRFDLIVSNPPYVPERDKATLSADVRDFEPASALFAGEDGLAVLRQLIPGAADALERGGHLVMEIGAGQEGDVGAIVRRTGLNLASVRHDLQGIPRVVIARQPG